MTVPPTNEVDLGHTLPNILMEKEMKIMDHRECFNLHLVNIFGKKSIHILSFRMTLMS